MDRNQRFYIAVATKPGDIINNDTPAIVGIGTLAIAVIGFLGAWAFQTITSGWKEDFMELRAQVSKLEANHTASCELFVRRDDYIRAMSSIDKKLDDMATRQDRQFQILLDKLIHARSNDSN